MYDNNRTHFLAQKIANISFLAGRQHLFKLFGLFGEYVSSALSAL
jgi:hypothetical protein